MKPNKFHIFFKFFSLTIFKETFIIKVFLGGRNSPSYCTFGPRGGFHKDKEIVRRKEVNNKFVKILLEIKSK